MNTSHQNGRSGEIDPEFSPVVVPHPAPISGREVLTLELLIPLPDGGFILGCHSHNESTPMLVRITPDHKLDLSFGQQGYAYVRLQTAVPSAENPGVLLGLHRMEDGKLIARLETGVLYRGRLTRCPVLIRFNSDGTRDSTFAEDGVHLYALPGPRGQTLEQLPDISSGESSPAEVHHLTVYGDLKVMPDGKILLLTTTMDEETSAWRTFVLRLNDNGELDPTFNGTGIMEPRVERFRPYRLLPQDNGKFLISGRSYTEQREGFIARFDENGYLDKTFGTDGYFTDFGDGLFTRIYSLLPDKDSHIAFTGRRGSGQLIDRATVVVGKIDSEGRFSPDFNGGQAVIIESSSADEYAELTNQSALIDSSGRIVVGGRDIDFSTGKVEGYLARLLENGQADSTFGTNGVVHYPRDQIIDVLGLAESPGTPNRYYLIAQRDNTVEEVLMRLLA